MERKFNSLHTFILIVNYAGELPNPTNTQTEAESQHNSLSSLSFQSLNENYTRGIDVQQTSISGVGDVSIWEFSGRDFTKCCMITSLAMPTVSMWFSTILQIL